MPRPCALKRISIFQRHLSGTTPSPVDCAQARLGFLQLRPSMSWMCTRPLVRSSSPLVVGKLRGRPPPWPARDSLEGRLTYNKPPLPRGVYDLAHLPTSHVNRFVDISWLRCINWLTCALIHNQSQLFLAVSHSFPATSLQSEHAFEPPVFGLPI